jgi:hypothetical protein
MKTTYTSCKHSERIVGYEAETFLKVLKDSIGYYMEFDNKIIRKKLCIG